MMRRNTVKKITEYRFLFEQLVRRDFTLKYKRTVLGLLWSVLSPLLNLLITGIIMSHFFGSNIDHYIVFLFIGNFCFPTLQMPRILV